MVILNQTEMEEAVRDWCKRHGIPVEGKELEFVARKPPGAIQGTPERVFSVELPDIEMPLSEGPYR